MSAEATTGAMSRHKFNIIQVPKNCIKPKKQEIKAQKEGVTLSAADPPP